MPRVPREIECRVYPFADLISALEANEIDIIMAGMSITEPRKKRVRFSNPYMVVGQMGIVRAADAAKFSGPQPLSRPGLKVGVHLGSTGEQYVMDNLEQANMISYDSVEDGLAALRDARIDAFVHDSTTSWQLSRSFVNDNLLSLNRFLTRESIAWATRRGDRELHKLVNYALEDMKEEGDVSEVIDRWLPMIPVKL